MPKQFALGRVVITPGAAVALSKVQESESSLLLRHSQGDWGDLSEDDRKTNEEALLYSMRLFSSYPLSSGETLWVITEADRSATTLLLPSEY